MIPWGHHIQIINKCNGNTDKALFFVRKTYENNWSRRRQSNHRAAYMKAKDNVLAQYATSAINVPVGISEYELNNLIPEDYKSSMPTIEEIERELKD